MGPLKMRSVLVLLLLTVATTSGQGIPGPSCISKTFDYEDEPSLVCSSITNFSFITSQLSTLNQSFYTLKIVDSPDLLLQPEDLQHPLMDQLRRVYVLGSNLTTNKPELFILLSSLKELFLDDNIITELGPNSLKGLEGLNHFSVQSNQIATISQTTFINMTQLKNLVLAINKLEVLSDNMFEGLRHLEELNLTSNFLTHIGNSSFKGMVSLRHLEIEDNQITTISSGAFQDLTKLKYLLLGNNRLAYLDSGLTSNSHLIWLNLYENNIKDLGNFPLNIPSLEYLYLSNNQIQKIPINYFSNFPNLTLGDVSENNISVFKPEMFKNVPSYCTITFNNNSFTSVDVATFIEVKNDAFYLLWKENPWNCTHSDMLAVRSYCTENALDFDNYFRCSDNV